MESLHVFGWFLYRDLYIYAKKWRRIALNFIVFIPLSLSISFGYILPYSNLVNPTVQEGTIFFAGAVLWILFPLAFLLNLDLLYDFEQDRFIQYQVMHLNPKLLLLEKSFYASIITFINVVPFYPIAKLLLRHYFYTAMTSWPLLFIMLYCGSLFCAIFNIFFLCFIKNSQTTGIFWMRVNNPLITFGGLFVPWHIMKQYSVLVGSLMLFNPLLYVTEGIRRSLLGSSVFLPISVCITMLFCFSLFFMLLASYFFKKKLDHI